MPRKGPIPKREILPDPKYGNLKLAKFVNNLMERGKKSTAEKIIYSALDEISNKAKRDPLEIFEEALDQVGPHVEVKSRRVGGATYQVPLEVKSGRKMAIQNQEIGFDPDALRLKYKAERDKRVRADGNDQYQEVEGDFAYFVDDPYIDKTLQRGPVEDEIEVAIIGGGFGGMLALVGVANTARRRIARPAVDSAYGSAKPRCCPRAWTSR